MSSPHTIEVNAEFIKDPWPIYEKLRADGPVHKIALPSGLTAWLIIGYDEAKRALTDPAFSKDLVKRLTILDHQLGNEHTTDPASVRPAMLGVDPPDHTRLRKLAVRAFTAQASAKWRPRVEEIVAALIKKLHDQSLDGARGPVDLVAEYAYPLPTTVISDLLGVPEADRNKFGEWSRQIMDFQSPDTEDSTLAAGKDFRDFVRDLVAFKRANLRPSSAETEQPQGDLLDELIAATEEGDRLTDEELLSMIILLLIAGHETTVNLISTATAIIARNAELRAHVLETPEALHALIEETLRFEGPAGIATMRHTTAPVLFGEVEIPANELVLVGLGAANRDPAKFPEPGRFDPSRSTSGHLGFGHGIHFCLGAALARIEGEVAVRELFREFPTLTLAEDEPRWRLSFLRGRTELPVRLSSPVPA